MSAPISISVVSRPERSGLVITPSTTMSEPGVMSAATIGKAAEEGSAGTMTGLGLSSGRPCRVMRRPSPSISTRTSAPKWASIFSVWSREASALDDRGRAARVEAGEQHGRLDLRRGDGRAVDDRRGLVGALQGDRAAPALGLGDDLRAHQLQRIEDAPHRPLAQRRVAVESRA